MAKIHDKKTLLRMCRNKLEQIAALPKPPRDIDKPVFERLKREAGKLLEKAKKMK